MTKRRIVFVDAQPRGNGVDFGGEVAGYSFLPHKRSDRPLFGDKWSVAETVINVARQGFPTRVVLTNGEVIEVRKEGA